MDLVEANPAAGLVERAAALVPMLREQAAATEAARRVPREHFEALSEAGVFRMMAPRRYGGYEADFQTQCDTLAEIARGCASTSWVATIFSAVAWVAGVFPDEAQEEVFATRDPRISGALSPTGTAVRKDGGLVVNGRWQFNTGCHGSEWTLLNAILETYEGGVPTCLLTPSKEITILDDWYASGMAGTGSNTVVAEDLFVPVHRSLALPDLVEGRYPARHNSDDPYFSYPSVPVLIVNAGGTPIGTARGALEAFLERLPGRQITFTNYTSQAEAPVTHLTVGEAALKIDSADAHIRLACSLLDRTPGPMSLEARIKARSHVSYATQLAREAVGALFSASGASAIQSQVPIQRFQRDIQALANHALLAPATTNELYGRLLCGLEPNTTLF